jgi:hypothetical protein
VKAMVLLVLFGMVVLNFKTPQLKLTIFTRRARVVRATNYVAPSWCWGLATFCGLTWDKGWAERFGPSGVQDLLAEVATGLYSTRARPFKAFLTLFLGGCLVAALIRYTETTFVGVDISDSV